MYTCGESYGASSGFGLWAKTVRGQQKWYKNRTTFRWLHVIIIKFKVHDTISIYYWPDARWRWLDIGRVLFFVSLWTETKVDNQLDAKVMARAPISWLDKCRKYNHLIGYISISNFKFNFSNFQIQNILFCLPVFVAKRIFKAHQHLCFHSRWRFFWFHKLQRHHKKSFYLNRE